MFRATDTKLKRQVAINILPPSLAVDHDRLARFQVGLPGAAFLETLEPMMRRVGRGPISGDGAWPAAIMMSMIWPVALAPAYLVARSVPLGNRRRGLVALAVLLTTCVLIGVLVYGMAT